MIHFEILISYHDDPSRPSIPPLYPAQGRVCGFELVVSRVECVVSSLPFPVKREYHESLLLDPDSLRQELLGAPLSPKSSPTRTFPAAADSPILMPTDKQTWRRAAC